ARPGEWTGDRGGVVAVGGRCAGGAHRGDLALHEPFAGWIAASQRGGGGGRSVVGGVHLAPGGWRGWPGRVAQHLLLGDARPGQVCAGGGQGGGRGEAVLVTLASAVEARDAQRGHDRERQRHDDEGQAQRAGYGKTLHSGAVWALERPGGIVPAGAVGLASPRRG